MMFLTPITITKQVILAPIVNMSRLIKILIIIIVNIYINTACAQKHNVEARFNGDTIALNTFLNKTFTEACKGKDLNLCLVSATFAKFTIDTIGNIKTIDFYENRQTPPIFKELLKVVIEATNGKWSPAIYNNIISDSKPFILPLIYQMEAGCAVKGRHVNNGTDNALMSLFTSESNKNTLQFDCILLKPLNVFSQN